METQAGSDVTVYWAPGCSSCLRVKEYLSQHGIAYRSRNIQTDPTAVSDLGALGVRRVPIVTKGDEWVDGQALADVARLCEIEFEARVSLPVDVLAARLVHILERARESVLLFDAVMLREEIPDGKRSFSDLAYHVFSVAEVFLEHDSGQPVVFESYSRLPPPNIATRDGLAAYGADVIRRVSAWFDAHLATHPWGSLADVYYDRQNNRQFLERTAWHSGQHLRQLLWRLDRAQSRGLVASAAPLFKGLPMPSAVWHSDTAL
jgi:glutaredoxin